MPRDLPGPSGGTHFDFAVISALTQAGHAVRVYQLPGDWPRPTPADRRALQTALLAQPLAVVDGIVALAAPTEIEAAVRMGIRVHILVHSLLTADPGLDHDARSAFTMAESAALAVASSSSVPSQWSATDIATRYPGVRTHVVPPGTSPAPPAVGSDPPQLLVLAALTPLKNQLHALQALALLSDLPWTLELVGSDELDPAYVGRLRHSIEHDIGPGRVTLRGAVTGEALDALWEATDLLVLTSTSETFGMVITEALARGVPAVVTGATGAAEALRGQGVGDGPVPVVGLPGAVVDPSDPAVLADTLRLWLSEDGVRSSWRSAALARRPRLQTWHQSAAALARIMTA
ncbi:glycosyltransferase family 4 protein [Tessaracoccus antarcticus]|uniref:Glycosyltransferase family 1 protein n=1 Tax=Tessaracoccus antarcticus TaxID=2479848 RepID=A0A3M0G5L6_9ACTN|nr:glycosyltransferase family 4 protein [Tessaracoccus antarcticus]RMB60185.1 glycosyltransferase family 1 protein [Tessaracoccus antarcticus]